MTEFQKPRSFDANLIVIGGGSAGLISAYIAAALKARVVLIEAGEMGGDCLNSGCVPSKALIAAAKRVHTIKTAGDFGIHVGSVEVDFKAVMDHVQGAIDTIAPNDSMERYRELGVDCIAGYARFIDPWTIEVNGKRISARSIVIATGAAPAVPPIPGLNGIEYRTSDNLWRLEKLPEKLCVLGGGPIGSELSQAFARLGSDVTMVEMQPRLLAAEHDEVSSLLHKSLESDGVKVMTDTRAVEVQPGSIECQRRDEKLNIDFDEILVATGRRARVEGFGAEEIGIQLNPNGTISSNGFLQTNHPHIYVCGDVAGPYQFTHAASHQAWHASVNALLRPIKRFRVNYDAMPWTIYTNPEISAVGLNESAATKQGIDFEVTRFTFDELDRAIAENDTNGFVRVLTAKRKDKILGATVVGHGAGEMIGLFTIALQHKIGLGKLLSMIVPYPGWNDAVKRAAGVWKKAHAPEALYPLVERFHGFMRR